MKTKFLIIIIIFTIILSGQDKTKKIDSLMNLYSNHNKFNGTVLVVEKGKVVYKKGFGFASFEHKIKNNEKTKFLIASMTKQFTAMIILQLAEEGKIKLDGYISDYIPEYPETTGKNIKIAQLLSHTAGIPHYQSIPEFFISYSTLKYEHSDFIKLFQNVPLVGEPGEKFYYSSFGYYLLGYIIERVTGKKYEEVLKEKILIPLKMVNTGIDNHRIILENRAEGYEYCLDGFLKADYRNLSTALATGDMYSTVEDLVLWDKALYENKLIGEKYKKIMFTPVLANYAYGWYVAKKVFNGKDTVMVNSHSGSTNGFNSLITRYSSHKNCIIVLSNAAPTEIYNITGSIEGILFNYKPVFKKSPSLSIIKELMNNNIEGFITSYRKLAKNDYKSFSFTKNELLNIATQLVNAERVEDAIKIIRFNIELYPDYSENYSKLADLLLMEKKDKKDAMLYYKKSIMLNPEDIGSKLKLEKYIN